MWTLHNYCWTSDDCNVSRILSNCQKCVVLERYREVSSLQNRRYFTFGVNNLKCGGCVFVWLSEAIFILRSWVHWDLKKSVNNPVIIYTRHYRAETVSQWIDISIYKNRLINYFDIASSFWGCTSHNDIKIINLPSHTILCHGKLIIWGFYMGIIINLNKLT